MNKLQSIENALISINDSVFQELCDCFLALRNRNYSVFSRTGSQTGKQKTIKGTPDTFFLLPNSKYLFVEYSTNKTKGFSKLKEDINKCLDTSKTGVSQSEIEEIILCINFNLKTNETQDLKALLSGLPIILTIYTLDALSIELHLNHRNLTHLYLGTPLDTGQIVSIALFMEEYNRASKGIATPLDNTFLCRENELRELNKLILEDDFIILTGAPGIGKTKLALEGIKLFLENNSSFGAYCVSYKSHSLLDDLYQYFNSENDYILFVDDANRIDAFNQITGFYKASRTGKLKIIITVRDYAFQEIELLCHEFSPKRINLNKFTNEEIVEIIKAEPFNIHNAEYQNEIIKIADGNSRIAIMTTLLAINKQDISVLSDLSELFEIYFTTFVKDDGEFEKKLNIQCLGIIAFFYTIPYKDKTITTSILNDFEIDYTQFIEAIDTLNDLELLEIQFDHVKIQEQNLSTYFFYKAFVKDDLLSFETLLDNYFDENKNRFRDCVIPVNNIFGYENVFKKLQPQLKNAWELIKINEEKALRFLSTFWFYLQNETLEFAYEFVDSLPVLFTENYTFTHENNAFDYDQNQIIALLGQFFETTEKLKESLEISFEYVKKEPIHSAELVYKINERLSFDRRDYYNGFFRQRTLFQILIDGFESKDILRIKVFYELSKNFLDFEFQHAKNVGNDALSIYHYPVPNNDTIQNFRKNIWLTLQDNYNDYPIESFELLQSYCQGKINDSREIMEFDIQFLIEIIDQKLNPQSFEHCNYLQILVRRFKRKSITHISFDSITKKFINDTYKIFLKIDNDFLRDKEIYAFQGQIDYRKLKEEEIRKAFIFKNHNEIKEFYLDFKHLKSVVKNNDTYNRAFDQILDENCLRNFELGLLLFLEVIEDNNEIGFIPGLFYRNQLKTKQKTSFIWEKLQKHTFRSKGLCMLSFLYYMDDSLVSLDYAEELIEVIHGLNGSITIYFEDLEKFLKVKPNLFQTILRIILEKNENEGTQLQVWTDFFDKHFDQLGEDIELIKKSYLQQDLIHSYFDYEGVGFLNILKKDPDFLLQYVENLYSTSHFGPSSDDRPLTFIWHIENIERSLKTVFDFVVQKYPYLGVGEHFSNAFFKSLEGVERKKAVIFLFDYFKDNIADSEKLNVVTDTVRHSFSDVFTDLILLFLSLSQDVEIFASIWWRGNGGSVYSGDTNIGDVKAAEWKNILQIVEKSNEGIKLIPIKKYLNKQIEDSLKYAEKERQRRFMKIY